MGQYKLNRGITCKYLKIQTFSGPPCAQRVIGMILIKKKLIQVVSDILACSQTNVTMQIHPLFKLTIYKNKKVHLSAL